MKQLTQNYRPDVDGLRAIAVLGVILFHLGAPYFTGGFVGVDIFFVISGFVITQTLWNKIQNRDFSFKNFYQRRFWRIVPAYLVILLCTLIGAYYILSPGDLERLGRVVVSAVGFMSNFFFWSEAGYFDLEDTSKPLLHTWSLAVEAQFYLIYPLLLFCGLRNTGRKTQVTTFLITIIGFLMLSQWFLQKDPEGAFFLMPFRFFEFLLGGVLVFVKKPQSKQNWFYDFGGFIGLGLILGSYCFYTSQTPFPGLYGLIPTLGAAALIYAGKNTKASKIYDNKCVVWIGRISYSLYLVHWPLVVFFDYKELVSLEYKILIVLLSFAGAILLYYFVEQKFRTLGNTQTAVKIDKQAQKKTFLVTVLAMFCTGVLGFYISLNDGLEWRYKTSLQAFVFDRKKLQKARDPYRENPQKFTDNTWNILVLGDSHGTNVLTGIVDMENPNIRAKRVYFEDFCFHLLLGHSQHSETTIMENRDIGKCDGILKAFNSDPDMEKTDVIIFSMGWVTRQFPYIAEVADFLHQKINNPDLVTVVISAGPQFEKTMQKLHELVSEEKTITEINKIAFAEMTGINKANASLKILKQALPGNVIVVDKTQLMCEENLCYILGSNGVPYFFDGGHWTLAGSQFFLKRLQEQAPEIFPK